MNHRTELVTEFVYLALYIYILKKRTHDVFIHYFSLMYSYCYLLIYFYLNKIVIFSKSTTINVLFFLLLFTQFRFFRIEQNRIESAINKIKIIFFSFIIIDTIRYTLYYSNYFTIKKIKIKIKIIISIDFLGIVIFSFYFN